MGIIYKEVGYQTDYAFLRKSGEIARGTYVTKKHTPYHDKLHDLCDFARSGPIMSGPIPLHEIKRQTKKETYIKALEAKKIAKAKGESK